MQSKRFSIWLLTGLIVFIVSVIAVRFTGLRPASPVTPTSPVATTETSPLATPVPLEAWIEPNADLKSWPPSKPFVLNFNQPVDIKTVSEISLSYPGGEQLKSSWNEAYTRLTIEPVGSLMPDSTFKVELGDVRGVTGARFVDAPPRWQVHVIDAPRVTRVTPYVGTMLDQRRPTIQLAFDRPMYATTVQAALKVQPPVPINVRQGESGLTLDVELLEPLTPGTRYAFTVTQLARDIYDIPLAVDFCWEYQVEDVIAEKNWLLRKGDGRMPLVIRFNYSMDPTSIQQAFSIEPPIKGGFTWSKDLAVITMTPEIALPYETTFTVRFKTPLREANGDPFPELAPFSLTTPPPILYASPSTVTNVHPATLIQITFDRLMDHAKTEAAFQITPAVPGKFEWNETTLTFQPTSGYLADATTYIVTVGVDARDAEGNLILRGPYTWTFRTGQMQNVADFGSGPNAQVVDADGRRVLQFQTRQVDPATLTFDLYRLNLEQFLDRYSSGFRGVAGSKKESVSTQGTTLVKSWQSKSAQGKNTYGSIQETLIPQDVPPGLYVLNLNAGRLNDQLIVILTRHNLVLKQAEDQIVAWVTDINGGQISDMEVVVYARDVKLLSQGRTDENGVFRATVGRDPQPLIVIARKDEDITAAGLSNEWQSRGTQWDRWWMPMPTAQKFAAYIYTDRPIYRPGQTVFYKGILRNDDDAIISVPVQGVTVTTRIRDARDNVVQTFQFATNELGTVNGKFDLAEGAMLGDYAIEMVVDGESHRQVFKVQDYRKPDYQVSVTSDAPRYLVGDTVSVTVDSRYFFGEPVPNAQVQVKLYELAPQYYWMGTDDAGEYVWFPASQGEMPNATSGSTDVHGRLTFTFKATMGSHDYKINWGSSLSQNIVGVEATVDDGSRQTVSSFGVVKVFNAVEQLSLDYGSYFKTPGQLFTVRAKASTTAAEPVSGRALRLQLRRYNSKSNYYTDVIQSVDLTTGADGQASLPFTVQEAGYYQLYLSGMDRLGHETFFKTWIYVFSDAARWIGRGGGLSIIAEQPSYAPGEMARLVIQSPFSGPALLTFERGTTRRERLVQLTAPATVVNVPIQADDAPNIFVTVNAWVEQNTAITGNTFSNLPDSRLQTARLELRVPVTDKTLNVSIVSEGEPRPFAPRENVTFTLRVTNVRGEPVSAELSLALVDEAIFSLSKELSGPMFDAFYRPRPDIVRTYDAMALYRYLGGGRGGGGGGGEPSGNPRSDFPDTAAWLPVIRTDADGKAIVTLTLPDNLTSWRITAKAVTANSEVGEAYINITTHQPIVVRPALPRALTAGDQVELSALVHNYSDRARDIQVSIEAPSLTIKSQVTQTVNLARGEIRIVGWSAQAANAGEAQVTVRANAGDLGDAVRLPLLIRPLAVPDVESQVGEFTGELDTTFTLPEGALDLSTVKIQVSRSIAGTLLDGLAYLTGYPYGCVEQTMSRALPNAVVGRAFKQLGVSNPTVQADLPPKINAGLQKLYGYQHNDGGWGWWYDDATHDYQTAWVVFGLSVTKDAGYEVDPQVIQRGAAWLKANLGKMDIRTRAYALYGLSVAGYGDLKATKGMITQTEKLDAFSHAALALALDQLGAKAEAQQMLDVLVKSAIVKDGEVYWPNARDDGHYYEKTMASTTRSTALALSAFARINPKHELEPGIVRYLMNQRRPQGWGSTNETSFAILALTDHLLATEELIAADTGYSVELNGEVINRGTLNRGEPAVSLDIPARQMNIGSNRLRITQSGQGRLYYVVNRRAYVPRVEIQAAGNVTLTREYIDPKTSRSIGTVKPGQLVEVRLKVTLPDDGFFIIVEDNLPGGLEALNEKLNTTSHEAVADQEPRYYWRDYGYNNKEVYGDRVNFFITEMGKGVRTFTYLARATTTGEFIALPTQVYAMYNLTTWGRSASNRLVVAE